MEKDRGITITNVNKQKQCHIHVVINRFLSEMTKKYIGDSDYQRRIMIDSNGVNIITEDLDGNIIKVDCMENL